MWAVEIKGCQRKAAVLNGVYDEVEPWKGHPVWRKRGGSVLDASRWIAMMSLLPGEPIYINSRSTAKRLLLVVMFINLP